ncbi:hypothetical protein JR065_01355 [Xanthomonas sp. AmX2]|uniref:hypothetical protein n=1 Tax=Xanthomonas sp. TaxID=29446 RepID=UPI00197D23C1|nr:hypothetical protein [Xanthomonas sp.]MBN6148974.1 hypothetical protein [Xanthomonas sp.]
MHLNLLVLQESDAAVLPENGRIRRSSHHITQMFMALLPKMEINGSSKIVVSLGPRGNEAVFDNVLGVTNVFVEDFDFEHFLSLDRPGQDIRLLEELRGALVAIAQRSGGDGLVKLVESTADSVLNAGFRLLIPIKRLAKRSKDGKRKVTVFKLLNSDVGEAWYCEVASQGDAKAERVWMHEVPGFIDRRELFKSAELGEGAYRVSNRLGHVAFEMPLRDPGGAE